MTRVLILGATGFVGNATATALVREGHKVYGLARTPEKAVALKKQEIIPVGGDASNTESWASLLKSAQIDVVIDSTTSYGDNSTVLSAVAAASRERLSLNPAGPKIGYIYVSGAGVHGEASGPTFSVSDVDPVGVPHARSKTPEYMRWRTAFEYSVLEARDVLDAAVVRPVIVWGRDSWSFGPFWDPILSAARSEGAIKSIDVHVSKESVCSSFVHVEDCGDGIAKLVEKLPLVSGTGTYPVFDLCASHERWGDIVELAAKAWGYEGEIKLVGAGDDMVTKVLNMNLRIDSKRARTLLGWEPKRLSVVAEIETAAMAYAAAR